jgi:hypothetical protein
MKLSQLLKNYNPSLKAKLNKSIKLDNGHVFKKGTVSDLLIQKDEVSYHFESQNNACTVSKDEITFIKKTF